MSWREFRRDLDLFMKANGVRRSQVLAVSQAAAGAGPLDGRGAVPIREIRRSTLYGYLSPLDKRIGTGDWLVMQNILSVIALAARQNGHTVPEGFEQEWKRRWDALHDGVPPQGAVPVPNVTDLPSDSWIGAWDGGGDAVLSHESAAEYVTWPPGVPRLDQLAAAVTTLGAACEPALAQGAAVKLAAGAAVEFGVSSPKTLAARHAHAFWTGQAGHWAEALRLTGDLLSDCQQYRGQDHILTRLARLRMGLWLTYLGEWREANRLYVEVARSESGPRGNARMLLLARWGRARTGGLSGNWIHADGELGEILPDFARVYGPDHPICLDAAVTYAWAVGRVGRAEEALERLQDLTSTLGAIPQGHPAVLRLRAAHAYWTWHSHADPAALKAATSVSQACRSGLGHSHPVTLAAVELQAIALAAVSPVKAVSLLEQVARARTRLLPDTHPVRALSQWNLAVARARLTQEPHAALSLLEDGVTALEDTLGPVHPETLRAHIRLAEAMADVNAPSDVADHAQPLADRLRNLLGPSHPETLLLDDMLERLRHEHGLPEPAPVPPEPAAPPPPPAPAPTRHSERASTYDSGFSTYSGDSGGASSPSDRRLKKHITPVDWTDPPNRHPSQDQPVNGDDLLERIRSLPVSTWSYLWEPPGTRHLGPMAHDWHQTLGLGSGEHIIEAVDINGVSLVAVQALARHMDTLREQITILREEITQLHGTRARQDTDQPGTTHPTESSPGVSPQLAGEAG